MSIVDRPYRSLYAGMILSFTLFGITLTILGAVLPRVIEDFGWSYTSTGLVLAAGAIGYFVSTFSFGHLAHRYGLRVILAASFVITGLACVLFGLTGGVVFNFIVSGVIGIGHGGIEVTVNTTVVRIERRGESRLMGFAHAAFSVGAVIGPLTAGAVLALSLPWQTAYRILGALFLISAALPFFLPFDRISATASTAAQADSRAAEKHGAAVGSQKTGGRPIVIIGMVIIFLYVGIEVGLSNWAGEYFVNRFGISAKSASVFLSLFWAGLLTGRVGIPLVASRIPLTRQLIFLAVLTTASLATILALPAAVPAATAFFVTGLGCSSVYPLVMTLVGQHLASGQSIGVGIVATGGGIGSFSFPFIMALIAERFGLTNGFLFFVFTGVLLISAAAAMHIRVKQLESRPEGAL